MASTRTNEISADPKDPKTPLSVRLNSELCHKAESLYHELGISLSSAITVFLVGTISVGSLPFQPSATCMRFLKTKAHLDLFATLQEKPFPPFEYQINYRSIYASQYAECFLDVPENIGPGNFLWEKRDKTFSLSLHPSQVDAAKTIFKKMGLALSDALTVFLQQSLNNKGLPFQPSKNLHQKMEDSALKWLKKELKSGFDSGFDNGVGFFTTKLRDQDSAHITAPFHISSEECKQISRLITFTERDPDFYRKECASSYATEKKIIPGKDIRLIEHKIPAKLMHREDQTDRGARNNRQLEIYEFVQYDKTTYPPFTRIRLLDGRDPMMLLCISWFQRQQNEVTPSMKETREHDKEKKAEQRRRHRII